MSSESFTLNVKVKRSGDDIIAIPNIETTQFTKFMLENCPDFPEAIADEMEFVAICAYPISRPARFSFHHNDARLEGFYFFLMTADLEDKFKSMLANGRDELQIEIVAEEQEANYDV